MASLGQIFDASSVDPTSGYDVLPPAKYLAQIVNSEMRATKDGLGQYLFLEVDVIDGPYAGRKLFDRLNLINANADAVQIAQRTLSSICRAVGKLQVSNSEQLHLIPLIADVRVRPAKGMYGESNSIRYLPRNAQAANSPTFNGGQASYPSQTGYQAAPSNAFANVGVPPGAPSSAPPGAPAPTAQGMAAANGLPWKRLA
jgi:Protein of unknown function (DUF669)